jgi:hypothetical protein
LSRTVECLKCRAYCHTSGTCAAKHNEWHVAAEAKAREEAERVKKETKEKSRRAKAVGTYANIDEVQGVERRSEGRQKGKELAWGDVLVNPKIMLPVLGGEK